MSLTQLLSDRTSPVREYFAARFPHVRSLQYADIAGPPEVVHTDAGDLEFFEQAVFPRGTAPLVLPADEVGFDWALAGTAFDYRLRFELQAVALEDTAADQGRVDLVRLPMGERATDSGWADLLTSLAHVPTPVRDVTGGLSDEIELHPARLCGLLGLYEQIYRMGGILNPAVDDLPIVQAGLNQPLRTLLDLVPDRVPADVAAMAALARSRAPQLLSAQRVVTGPTFARSRDLRGADADLVLDGTLWEVKTTKHARLSQAFVWQVLGYLLADTDDAHHVDHVGWYFARHAVQWTFSVPEFLQRLAGEPVDLADARAQFADVCAAMRAPTLAPSPSPAAARPAPLVMHVDWQLGFLRPAHGSGRWHAPAGAVPWLATVWSDQDPDAPACGTRVDLNVTGPCEYPPLGGDQQGCDPMFCRRCLLYTSRFYAEPFDNAPVFHLADLPYLPPVRATGKWHIRSGNTPWPDRTNPNRPACGAAADLDLNGEPLHVPAGEHAEDDADTRLCRRCMTTTRVPVQHV